MRVRVLVRLRPGIMDVQGAAVQRALIGLGFADLRDLRVGKVVEVEVDAPSETAARARVDEMCKKLLANPVLEDYSIETMEGASLAASSAVR